MSGSYDVVRAFAVHDGTLVQSSQTSTRFTFPGSNPTLSSNGEKADSAILWVVESKGILHAYAANNLSRELYNSAQQPQRDALSSYVKFSTPTVANGRVFVATKESLVIYGLLPAVRN